MAAGTGIAQTFGHIDIFYGPIPASTVIYNSIFVSRPCTSGPVQVRFPPMSYALAAGAILGLHFKIVKQLGHPVLTCKGPLTPYQIII